MNRMKTGTWCVDAMSDEVIYITNEIELEDDNFYPYEGLVMEISNGQLRGWSMKRIEQRILVPAGPAIVAKVAEQFNEMKEELFRSIR